MIPVFFHRERRGGSLLIMVLFGLMRLALLQRRRCVTIMVRSWNACSRTSGDEGMSTLKHPGMGGRPFGPCDQSMSRGVIRTRGPQSRDRLRWENQNRPDDLVNDNDLIEATVDTFFGLVKRNEGGLRSKFWQSFRLTTGRCH